MLYELSSFNFTNLCFFFVQYSKVNIPVLPPVPEVPDVRALIVGI